MIAGRHLYEDLIRGKQLHCLREKMRQGVWVASVLVLCWSVSDDPINQIESRLFMAIPIQSLCDQWQRSGQWSGSDSYWKDANISSIVAWGCDNLLFLHKRLSEINSSSFHLNPGRNYMCPYPSTHSTIPSRRKKRPRFPSFPWQCHLHNSGNLFDTLPKGK